MLWTNSAATLTANVWNMQAGGTYMLIINGGTTGTGTVTINCFSDAGSTSLPSSFIPTNGARVATGSTTKTVYTLMSDGTNCLIVWTTGF